MFHVGLCILVYTCVNARVWVHVHVWMVQFCAWAWIYLFVCVRVCVFVCACGCVSWCLFCALLLMHRHSRDVCTNGSWSCRGCIDCSDLQIIALKSDQQQPTKVKTSLTNRSPAALPWEATCLIVCGILRPLLLRALGEKVQGLTFPLHSQPHSHIDWEMYQCSSLQHCSNYQTQTKLEPLSTGIGTLYPLEAEAAYALNSTKVRNTQCIL